MNIWLEVGVQSNNSQRYISLNSLHLHFGETPCKSLPAYHALTGCDYTASFSRRGKVKPLKTLEEDVVAQEALASLGSAEDIPDKIIKTIERYVSSLYGKKKLRKINEVRVQIFLEKYRPKAREDRLSCAKKLDGSMMPPCRAVLLEKLKCMHLITRRWNSTLLPHPPHEVPENSGWKLEDGCYKINWFYGEAAPRSLDVVCNDETERAQEGTPCSFMY